MIDEKFDQQGNVFSSFPQRRNLNRKDVETVKQIATKGTRSDGSFQIAIGGSDDPHVSSNTLIAGHTLKLSLLQNAQERNLSFGRQLAHFVKEDGAFVRKLEPTEPPLQSSRESSSLVAKQFRGNQRSGNGGTTHTDEGA
jgi:hypothetical protein